MKKVTTPLTYSKGIDNHFKDLFDHYPEAIFFSKVDNFEIIYVNDAFRENYGSSRFNLNQMWDRALYPDDKDKFYCALDQARSSKSSIDIPHRLLNTEKKIIKVINTISWAKDATGKYTMMYATLNDITRFGESEDKYQRIFNYSPVSMMELDFSRLKKYIDAHKLKDEKQITQYFLKHQKELIKCYDLVKVSNINPATLLLFNAQDEDTFRTAYKNRFARDSNDVFYQEMEAIALGKTEFEKVVHIFSLGGKRHQIIMKWSLPYAYKMSYAVVLVTFIDSTVQRKLAESMHIKNFAIESSNTSIVITDLEGKVTYANSAFYNLWNIEFLNSLLGESIEKFLPYEGGGVKILQNLHTFHKWRGTLVIDKESLQPKYVECSAIFIVDEYGEPLGLVFSFIDITEHMKTEHIRLEFTNIAAHELKTPLTPIKVFLSMIHEKGFGINQEGKKYISICVRNINRLSLLIGDILDISRLEAKGMKFHMDKFDFLKLIKVIISDNTPVAQASNLILSAELPTKLPHIIGDKSRLRQVIGNLIKNAIAFTQVGRILIRVKVDNENITTNIIDTGAGIAKSDIPKLFTKFFQAQDITTRTTKGSGLGLAISKEIIQAHGGSIWATSEGLGKGSTFSFSLPLISKIKVSNNEKSKTISKLDELALLKEKQKSEQ